MGLPFDAIDILPEIQIRPSVRTDFIKLESTQMTVLFFLLALLATLLALHPFFTYPLSLQLVALLHGRKSLDLTGNSPTSATVMISARNEAAIIAEKLRSVQAAIRNVETTQVEVLLFADGCTDATVQIAQDVIGARNVIDGGVTAKGKTDAMNALASRATGDVLVLTDANSIWDPKALANLLENFRDDSVGVVLGSSVVETTTGSQNGLSALLAGYWRIEENLRALETDVGSTIGGDGALYGVRASLWPYPESDIIDDFFVPMSVLLSGNRVIFSPTAIIHEASVTSLKDEGPRKYRIAARALRAHRALRGKFDRLNWMHRYMYVSHKVLKWMLGFNCLLAVVFAVIALSLGGYGLQAAAGFAVLTTLLLMGALRPDWQPAGKAFSAFISILQVSRGALFGLRGGSIAKWTPPVSDRRIPR